MVDDKERRRAERERLRSLPKVVPVSKTCPTCEVEKDASEFWKMSASRDGLQVKCKACQTAYEKANYGPGRGRPGARARYFRQTYGLTEDQLAARKVDQGCVCAICGEHRGALVVDHDHQTGAIRGLLCHQCNRGLGMLGDSVDSITAALAYLMTSQDVLAVRGE